MFDFFVLKWIKKGKELKNLIVILKKNWFGLLDMEKVMKVLILNLINILKIWFCGGK